MSAPPTPLTGLPRAPELTAGLTVVDRYVLEAQLGEGGVASVWSATDAVDGSRVALKFMRDYSPRRRRLEQRFLREARVMMRLRHPRIARVHGMGTSPYGPWYVMDLAQCTVEDAVFDGPPGAVSPPTVVRWVLEALEGLGAAHALGVIHRDLKPANLLLPDGLHAVVSDFGIALVRDAGSRDTRTGATLGSMLYMAPEQRIDARNVRLEADIYAMGATLFHLLTRATPMDLFLADASSRRWAHVPEPLRPVIRRAVMLEPEQRFRSAGDLAVALKAAMPMGQEPPVRPYRRAPVPAPLDPEHDGDRAYDWSNRVLTRV